MAGGNGAWGIDIGQSGLKALRATLADDGEGIIADAFDFIEYPKILSQPDANPDQLVRDALKEFLSRNELRGDKVAISVSGQSGLARFIKLPPVDAKKIPDIVKYEAKQQIPFELDDVIWDFQVMPGSDEEEGFALDTEVGLFAMKRDQVFRFIRPMVDAEVELDVIQLTPICIYNALTFDAPTTTTQQEIEAGKVPASVVIISLGTETSDLVVTNGLRLWQRSVPIGGNHFTKQLTKDMKLTFAKAEHVKRNAREAEDAKKLYQAMRPVFNDLVTEIQRSLGYFRTIDRTAELSHILVMGNAVKLPGLPQYLEKSLSMEVKKFDRFNRLHGLSVLEAPAFKDNVLAFPVCYGLVLQGLKQAQLSTNLLPPEILKQRLIRRKKPWAAAIAAAMLLACVLNYFFHWTAWDSVHENSSIDGVAWKVAQSAMDQLKSKSGNHISQDDDQKLQLARLHELGSAAVGSADGRLLWLELLKTITESLPVDESNLDRKIPTREDKPFEQREEIYIDRIESQYFPEISTWLTNAVKEKYEQGKSGHADELGVDAAEGESAEEDVAVDESTINPAQSIDVDESEESSELEGSGWVIDIHGHHFRPEFEPNSAAEYVRTTLLNKLDSGTVELPVGEGKATIQFTVREMGIHYPFLLRGDYTRSKPIPNPNWDPPTDQNGMAGGMMDSGRGLAAGNQPQDTDEDDPTNQRYFTPPRYEFLVQFCWQQVTLSERLDNPDREKSESTQIASNTDVEGR
jgi:type IV pilus assembly protein PilM